MEEQTRQDILLDYTKSHYSDIDITRELLEAVDNTLAFLLYYASIQCDQLKKDIGGLIK